MGDMRTLGEELWSRIKTLLWTTFWVAATFLVDNLAAVLVGVSLPDIATDFGGLLPTAMTIKTSVVVGLVINQISKYMHNRNVGKVI